MKTPYTQLTLQERESLSIFKAEGKSLRKIAVLLGRNHSTLSRELRRNSIPICKKPMYLPSHAQVRTRQKKSVAAKRPRLKHPLIRNYVAEKIRSHWSPEQVAGRLSWDLPQFRISHEAIYQYIYEHAWELFPYLARKHRRRRLRFYYRRAQGGWVKIPGRTFIDQRPEVITQRGQFGHWEADSMVSRANSQALHVLVERKSRYLKISKLSRNASAEVCRTVTHRLAPLPAFSRLSITYDNGLENAAHQRINQQLQTQSFFCHPYHSWEKGSVENSIGLVRRFLPKKTDFKKVSRAQLFKIQNVLNNRPRKCLNYKTPNEVFRSQCGALAT